MYNKKILKTKIKSYGDEATDFHDKEIPKAGSNHTSLAKTTIDSVHKKDENYCLQLFSKQCKYIEKKMIRYVTEDLEISSDDSDESYEE